MSSTDDLSNGERRENLEREAEVVRTRLSNRLSLLDRRKDRLIDKVKAASRPPLLIALLVGGGIALTAAIFIVRRLRQRPSELQRLLQEFMVEAKLLPPQPESPMKNAITRGLASGVAIGLREVGRRSVERLLAPSSGDVDVKSNEPKHEWATGS
jgi:hypothetical protein